MISRKCCCCFSFSSLAVRGPEGSFMLLKHENEPHHACRRSSWWAWGYVCGFTAVPVLHVHWQMNTIMVDSYFYKSFIWHWIQLLIWLIFDEFMAWTSEAYDLILARVNKMVICGGFMPLKGSDSKKWERDDIFMHHPAVILARLFSPSLA